MISIVAAMSENRAIGRDNDLPWKRLSADLKRFKSLTLGHHLIMGRRTYESVGKPLPGRVTVVVTRQPASLYPPEVKVATSVELAIELAAGDPEIFIGGGSEIFRQALTLSDRMYLTIVHATLDGDTFFPPFDENDWRIASSVEQQADDRNEYPMTFVDYVRQGELSS